MGSTSIEFRGREFEANDSTMEVWLALLVDEIRAMPDAPDWLRHISEEWTIMGTSHFGFGVDPNLDELISDDERRDVVLTIARRAMARLESLGPLIPAETLNGLRDWGAGFTFARDAEAKYFLEPARYFIKLLEGTLLPEENDARL
jgi:hypothetical protein